MSVLCGSFSACAKNAFSSSFFAHFCSQNTNSVCLSARFLHKSEEMGFLLLMAFLLKNLHFFGAQICIFHIFLSVLWQTNAKKTRVKSVKIFTNHTFYRYVWRGQNHCLAREKVRPREGKIPTTWHRKNLEFANFDIFIPEMNSIFSCPALVQSQISASHREPLLSLSADRSWNKFRMTVVEHCWPLVFITSCWIWFSVSPRAFAVPFRWQILKQVQDDGGGALLAFGLHNVMLNLVQHLAASLCCPSPLTDPETSSGWRWWCIVGLWSSITSCWI